MNLVRESISFKRGMEPKEALRVGMAHILSHPFDYDAIPPGKYILFSMSVSEDEIIKSESEYSYSCLGEKTDEGEFWMRSVWSYHHNDKPYTDSMHTEEGYDERHSRIASFEWQFETWIDRNMVVKMKPLSQEEFEQLLYGDSRYE